MNAGDREPAASANNYDSSAEAYTAETEANLDDLVQVVPAAFQAILVEGRLDLGTVESWQVNDLGEVRGRPDQPEHVPDLAS